MFERSRFDDFFLLDSIDWEQLLGDSYWKGNNTIWQFFHRLEPLNRQLIENHVRKFGFFS